VDEIVCHTLHYDGGHLALSKTHLLVARGNHVAESLALRHLAEARVEEAHSFRHRVGGLIAGIGLLVFGIAACAAGVNLLQAFRGKIGIGAIISIAFGIAFLVPVVTSRRIRWLRIRYGAATKLIPLPGVDLDSADQFVSMIYAAKDFV
jgi:hypothetical protein